MTPGHSAHRFFCHTVALLLLYTLVSLIAGLKFLPGDLTQSSLPFNQVSALATALLDLAVVGGLLGGGIYATIRFTRVGTSQLLRVAVLLWSLLTLLTLGAGLLSLLIVGSVLLSMLKIMVILLVVVESIRHHHAWTSIAFVWTVGMALSAIGTLTGLLPTSDLILAQRLHTLAFGVNTYIGSVLAAVALVYWLIPRFSSMTPLAADRGLHTVAGLLAVAGALLTVSGLELKNTWLNGISTLIIPLTYLIFAAQTYHAFFGQRLIHTQAAHWLALGVFLLLLGVGLLGGVQAAIPLWIAGTRLSDLQPTVARLAIVAIILGVIGQSAVETRSPNPSMISFASFWLIAGGSIGGAFMLIGAGLVQIYLERILSLGYLDTQALLVPLYEFWILGLVLLALGMMLYTLVFWLHHPGAIRKDNHDTNSA